MICKESSRFLGSFRIGSIRLRLLVASLDLKVLKNFHLPSKTRSKIRKKMPSTRI